MTKDEIIARISGRPWYHQIELAPGVVTPGVVDSRRRAQLLEFPADLTGKRVLDIGAYDGYFSFEAEKRGASYVLAYDHNPPDMYGFSTAKEILGSRVEHRVGNVYDLSPETVGLFDVVLFLGVIYHLRSPLLALERVHSVCTDTMYLESHVTSGGLIEGGKLRTGREIDDAIRSVPFAQFYAGGELNDDVTNWWTPTILCLEGWIRSHGFEPQFIADWPAFVSSRAAFRCRRLPGELPWFVKNY
ncbi:MAG TPA: DUF1698 domain-containing protein [Vicinamibacteria bacterium]